MPTSITRTDLRREMEGPVPPVLIEALGAAYFADAHLPGAINIPPGQVTRLAPVLIPDLNARIVVYCSGSATARASSLVSSRNAATPRFGSSRAARRTGSNTTFRSTDQRTARELVARRLVQNFPTPI